MKPIDLFHLSFLFAVGSANVSAQALSGSITVTAPLVREGGSPTISWDVVLPPPTTVTELVDIDATKGTITAKVNAKVTLKAVAAAVRPNTTEWYLVQSKLKIGNSAETLVFNDFHPNISGSLILNPNNQNILAGQTISFTAHCATGTGCLALQNGTWKNTTPAKPTVYSTSPASRWYPNYANGVQTAQGGYFNVALYKRGDSILNLQGALSTVSFRDTPELQQYFDGPNGSHVLVNGLVKDREKPGAKIGGALKTSDVILAYELTQTQTAAEAAAKPPIINGADFNDFIVVATFERTDINSTTSGYTASIVETDLGNPSIRVQRDNLATTGSFKAAPITQAGSKFNLYAIPKIL